MLRFTSPALLRALLLGSLGLGGQACSSSESGELAQAARDEFARASTTPRQDASPDDPLARAHGLLGAPALARVHRAAARDVVTPCADALLA